ncbi:MAG TPA: chemotaxis protein CheB [Acidimicrobiales bacterium]|jgi:two-component system chemotaxis response regulator CheB
MALLLADQRQPAIVALVCSAGGLEALTQVLGRLAPSTPAAVIVLQHQVPQQRSRLSEILARRCALPVRTARNGVALEPGHVVVVPPGRHALVTAHDRLALISTDGSPPYRPSADLLLTSLALVAPARSIGVILSGAGHDGATGATALHDFGGIVIAADEKSSAHFAMPKAAIERDEIVDYIVPVDKIADLLSSLVVPGGVSESIESEPA